MPKAKQSSTSAESVFEEFLGAAGPLEHENANALQLLTDKKTGARYCECHVTAKTLVALATTDVPLDPDEQAEYRANREIVQNHSAFLKMKDDAKRRRTFSNIVAEFTTDFDKEHPLKIIGGQHRFEAIKEAFEAGVNEVHGLKVYLMLTMEQRLDVQLISNTNIAVSADLFDRMQETTYGPDLRDWCQKSGLLEDGHDFADKRERGGPISVQLARTFITNYYLGRSVDVKHFETSNTSPVISPTGSHDGEWDSLKTRTPGLWSDEQLHEAANEFAELVAAQRKAFAGEKGKPKPKPDFPEKAMNAAILSAWAYIAGMLHDNEKRLKRHFALRSTTGRDPLNAAALTKGRHKSDPENYRGLGYRQDPKERGRFVELFFNQAEAGSGITTQAIDIAIKQYHAKQAQLEVIKAKGNLHE